MLSVLTEAKRELSNLRMAAWLIDQDAVYNARMEYDSPYADGKVYKICIGNDLLYIGSTCKTLEQRIIGHMQDLLRSDRPLYTFMRENNITFGDITIDVIEFFPCSLRSELVAREIEYINHLRPRFNIQGVQSEMIEPIDTMQHKEDRLAALFPSVDPVMKQDIVQTYKDDKDFRRKFQAILLELHGPLLSQEVWKALEGLSPRRLDRICFVQRASAMKTLCNTLGIRDSFDTEHVFGITSDILPALDRAVQELSQLGFNPRNRTNEAEREKGKEKGTDDGAAATPANRMKTTINKILSTLWTGTLIVNHGKRKNWTDKNGISKKTYVSQCQASLQQ